MWRSQTTWWRPTRPTSSIQTAHTPTTFEPLLRTSALRGASDSISSLPILQVGKLRYREGGLIQPLPVRLMAGPGLAPRPCKAHRWAPSLRRMQLREPRQGQPPSSPTPCPIPGETWILRTLQLSEAEGRQLTLPGVFQHPPAPSQVNSESCLGAGGRFWTQRHLIAKPCSSWMPLL